MHVNYAHLCDYAIVAQDRKLSIMGIFEVINATKVPVTHPLMFLAFELGFDYTEVGQDFTVGVQVVDEDGRVIFDAKLGGKLQSAAPAKPADTPTIGQIVAIQGLTFEKFGSYDVNIFANGKQSKRLSLKVTKVVPPTTPLQ